MVSGGTPPEPRVLLKLAAFFCIGTVLGEYFLFENVFGGNASGNKRFAEISFVFLLLGGFLDNIMQYFLFEIVFGGTPLEPCVLLKSASLFWASFWGICSI